MIKLIDILKEELLNEYSNNIIKKFKSERPDLDKDTIIAYVDRFFQIQDSPKVSQKDITKYTWDDLEKIVNDNLPKRIKAGKLNDGEPSKDANLVYNQNNLRIYAGVTKEACIKYGNGYSFCISARGNDNRYSQYRIEQSGTPYFVFDDTTTSEQYLPGKFEDPDHLLVVFAYDNGYTVTNANNDEGEGFDDFDDLEGSYPRLEGLENIFQPIEVNPKEKAEYETTIEYNDYFYKLRDFYLDKKHIDSNDFGFFSIESANTLIDDAINGNTQLYATNASRKDKNNSLGHPYQFKLYKSNESEDNIKKDFAINKLMFKHNDDTSLEDVLNNWDIKVIKVKKPVYTQYFQDAKKLVDEYRSKIAKLKLLKENLKKMIKLIDILKEVNIELPIPKFKTNDELADFLKKNPSAKRKIIDTMWNCPTWQSSNHLPEDPSWKEMLNGWHDAEIEQYGDYNEDDELMVDDGDDNRAYFSITRFSNYSSYSDIPTHKIQFGPNIIYWQYL